MGGMDDLTKQGKSAHIFLLSGHFYRVTKKYPVFFWEGNTGESKIAMGLYCT